MLKVFDLDKITLDPPAWDQSVVGPSNDAAFVIDQIRDKFLVGPTKDWFQLSLDLAAHQIDPFFRLVASYQPNSTLILAGGSDLVQLILGVAKNIKMGNEVNTLSVEDRDPRDEWVTIDNLIVPGFQSRPETVLDVLYLNCESRVNLECMVRNSIRGEQLVEGVPTLMVPIKHQAIAIIPASGTAKLFFRTAEDLFNYENKILTLPDIKNITAEKWLRQFSGPEDALPCIINTLTYSAVVYARGKAQGWTFDASSLRFLNELASRLAVDEITEVLKDAASLLSGPDSLGHSLDEVIEELLPGSGASIAA